MKQPTSPEWLDRKEYPFKPHYYASPAGTMHYVDEGKGDPIVFVHGNPSWSFEFRHVIKALSKHCRCIAPDHVGFGLSDKPLDWTYLPADQAANLERFLESLKLRRITLVFGDWGGPIGMSYAIRHPEKIKALVITNTWLWSVRRDWHYQAFSKFTGGPIGRFLIKKRNFFADKIVKSCFADKSRLTQEIHRHYLMPLADPLERKGNWTFPRQIVHSGEWLDSLWQGIDKIKDKRILIAWGMKDIAFREKELKKWMGAFPEASTVRYADAGHFVAEEKPAELAAAIRDLLC